MDNSVNDQTGKSLAEPLPPISREVKLLIAGALISFISSISTTYFNTIYEDKKDLRAKKYTVVEQLSKDLGLRLIITNQFHRANNSHDEKGIDSTFKQYTIIKEKFNSLNTGYQIQIGKFFGDKDRNFYIDSIHNPLVRLGRFCEYKDTTNNINERTYSGQYGKIEKRMYNFIDKVYKSIN
ncbi:MAG: hypothetical protein JWR02_323 [Mucilaginibacter sp.]|nr:hypothetical protein [Mucilaginibacter sp.]